MLIMQSKFSWSTSTLSKGGGGGVSNGDIAVLPVTTAVFWVVVVVRPISVCVHITTTEKWFSLRVQISVMACGGRQT